MVDSFSFWFSSRNLFQGAESIVMQTSTVFGPNFLVVGWGGGGREQKSLRGTPVEESQALDNIT